MSAPPRVPMLRYPPHRDTSWMVDANCAGLPSDFFFPERGQRIDPAIKQICAACPVQQECLEHGISNNEPGVWGGVGEHDRREMARKGKKH